MINGKIKTLFNINAQTLIQMNKIMEFPNTPCQELEDSPMYLKIIPPQQRNMEN